MKKFLKYKKSYCKKMLDFFNIAHTVEKLEVSSDRNGEKTKCVEKPNPLPTFEKFAVKIGASSKVLEDWEKQHPEFALTCHQCRELQKDMLNDLAMRGFYNPTYTIFVAKNITDMKDKQESQMPNFENIRDAYLNALKNIGNT